MRSQEKVIILGNLDSHAQAFVNILAGMSEFSLSYYDHPDHALNETHPDKLNQGLLGIVAIGEHATSTMPEVVAIQLAPAVAELPILRIANETSDAPVLTEISRFFLGLRVSQ